MSAHSSNPDTRELATALLRAESEAEAIEVLRQAGYWENDGAWRLYGDREGNFSTIGNQQSRPEAALVEKIVNSVDARLLNECLVRRIDPESSDVPATIRDAVSHFIEGKGAASAFSGAIASWTGRRQLEQARQITLAVTGNKPRQGMPCITIADAGEGQTPSSFPTTFLSIDRSNKLRIPFVQGKFNMGGTGALKFCGKNGLQLIISRRNPAILQAWKGSNSPYDSQDPRREMWGFTVVRRERPTDEQKGKVRSSVFRFLAPANGEVLAFHADQLPLFPDGNKPYARMASFGSVLKLYDYDVKGFASQALMRGGLLSRTEALLPSIGLPVRVHECRDYRGDEARSFENSLVGLSVRLAENRADNLEPGYPTTSSFVVRQEKMAAQIYAFKEGKAETYTTNEGIIFTINGQTHGYIPRTFYERSRVKMGRLAKSLLVIVDCTDLSAGAREDLFMNSRDRLSAGELRKEIEEELESIIRNHPGLKELQARRRAEEVANRLQESKPFEEIIDSILKSSPTLSRLFRSGQRLSKPHSAGASNSRDGGGQGNDQGSDLFKSKQHPSYFRFHKKHDGEELVRNAELSRRCRIAFDTDAPNDYFERDAMPGRYVLEVVDGSVESTELTHSCSIFNGIATWSIKFPEERVSVGDKLTVQCSVFDETRLEPFVNLATIMLVADEVHKNGKGGRRTNSSGGQNGSGGTGSGGAKGTGKGDGQQDDGGLQLPPMYEVHRDEWQKYEFDETSACRAIEDADGFSFYVNVDNIYLHTDLKDSRDDVALTKTKFVWGNVLVGLALLHESKIERAHAEPEETGRENLFDRIFRTTRALGPFLVPMIDYLGALSEDDVARVAQQGDTD